MKWMGIALGSAMFLRGNNLKNLVARGKPERHRGRLCQDGKTGERAQAVADSPPQPIGLMSLAGTATPNEYARLQKLLAECQYEEADRETWRLMLRVAGVHQRGYFEIRDFEEFPATVLRTIDRLWLEASEGRFGLSVQRQIYREEDCQYDRLGARLGWIVAGKWLKASNPRDRRELPVGNLPSAAWRSQLASFGFFGLGMCLEVFFSREDW